jgi:hypothetical protein
MQEGSQATRKKGGQAVMQAGNQKT